MGREEKLRLFRVCKHICRAAKCRFSAYSQVAHFFFLTVRECRQSRTRWGDQPLQVWWRNFQLCSIVREAAAPTQNPDDSLCCCPLAMTDPPTTTTPPTVSQKLKWISYWSRTINTSSKMIPPTSRTPRPPSASGTTPDGLAPIWPSRGKFKGPWIGIAK